MKHEELTILSGTDLKEWRQRLGLTLEGLARKADVTLSTVVNVEAGKNITVKTYQQIVAALTVAEEECKAEEHGAATEG